MSTQQQSVVEKVELDEDWWLDNQYNQGKHNFYTIPSVINGQGRYTKWWGDYWFGQDPDQYGKRGTKGYYVWGGGSFPQFDSIFDPTKTVEQTTNGPLLKVIPQPTDAPLTSELVMEDRFGFGYYAVTVTGNDLGNLDPNVVLGIFTYQFGASAGNPNVDNVHREIDLLETIAGYQQTNDQNNAQFALQPARVDGGKLISGERFKIPNGTTKLTTFMSWSKNNVLLRIYTGEPTFEEMKNDYPVKKAFASWQDISSSKVPDPRNERMHINFYVPNGRKGKGQPRSEQRVTITKFQYQSP